MGQKHKKGVPWDAHERERALHAWVQRAWKLPPLENLAASCLQAAGRPLLLTELAECMGADPNFGSLWRGHWQYRDLYEAGAKFSDEKDQGKVIVVRGQRDGGANVYMDDEKKPIFVSWFQEFYSWNNQWAAAFSEGSKKIVGVEGRLGGRVSLDDGSAFKNPAGSQPGMAKKALLKGVVHLVQGSCIMRLRNSGGPAAVDLCVKAPPGPGYVCKWCRQMGGEPASHWSQECEGFQPPVHAPQQAAAGPSLLRCGCFAVCGCFSVVPTAACGSADDAVARHTGMCVGVCVDMCVDMCIDM